MKKGIPALALLLFAALVMNFVTPLDSRAGWSNNVRVNSAIATAVSTQAEVRMVSDGNSGFIITWQDYRAGNWDIYAQRIDANGNALWAANAVPISTAVNFQQAPQLISDGSGGAIIVWEDARSGNWDIYAQRIDADGNVLWAADGIAAVTAANDQWGPQIVSDGIGGVIIVCYDFTTGTTDIYAQRVDADGNVLWAAAGVAITTAANTQGYFTVTGDGSSGAIIAWEDERNSLGVWDIYAQRIAANGSVAWAANGVAISAAPDDQWDAEIASDGNGGAIIVWTDYRTGDANIYAQRINAAGNAQWTPPDGIPVSAAANDQWDSKIISDGSGGAIVSWTDYRKGNNDIFAQKIDSTGAARWKINGVPVTVAVQSQEDVHMISDGSGGAIIAWEDHRRRTAKADTQDIYAQKINTNGVAKWTLNGVPVSLAVDDQYDVQLLSDGNGCAIMAWEDERSGTSIDIYAQKMLYTGARPAPIKVLSPNGAEVAPTGADLTIQWSAADNATKFALKYSCDGGLTWPAVVAGTVPGTSYDWTVPAQAKNKKCRIRVIGYDSNNVKVGADVSDAVFTLEVIRLTAPNGNESWAALSSQNITWTTNATVAAPAKTFIYYTLNGGVTWVKAATLDGNPNTYPWTLPSVTATKTNCKVKVELRRDNGAVIGSDISDLPFTITQ